MNSNSENTETPDDSNENKEEQKRAEKGCMVFIALFAILIVGSCVYLSWDKKNRCDSKCEHEQDICNYSAGVLREANDFDRERLLISKREHSHREDEIIASFGECMDRAEAQSKLRNLSKSR